MKAFTSIEQSKKLAEILPLITADMDYIPIVNLDGEYSPSVNIWDNEHIIDDGWIPAWSLAALLDLLPYPQLSKDKLGSGKEGWMVSVYPDNCRYDSCWHDNPVDACHEVILKLDEQKISDYGSTTL